MKAKEKTDHKACEGSECNPDPLSQGNGQTTLEGNPIDGNPLYEGLSSRVEGFEEREGEFSRQSQRTALAHIEARLKILDDPLTIPDDLMSEIEDYGMKYGHRDDPGERGHLGFVYDHLSCSTDQVKL